MVRKQLFNLPLLVLLLTSSVSIQPLRAQSITAAADGTGTVVTLNGQQFDISGGSLSGGGQNLFHSFQDLGLSPGEIANFLAQPHIRNILGRVVGGNASIIDGLIQVSNSNANLFLMNPAGIIFGPQVSLNVPASFTATTADGIGFAGGWFNASGASDYASLVGDPNQFAFSASNPGIIINAGNLAVTEEQSLMLLGGTAINTGTLTAPGGTITLAAVPGENLVRISQADMLLNLEVVPIGTAAGNPGNGPPTAASPTALDLPQLLTVANLSHAAGVIVDADGSLRLTGSTLALPTTTGTTIASGMLDASLQPSNPNGQSPLVGGIIQVLGDRIGVIRADIDVSGIDGGGTALIGGDYQGQGDLPAAARTAISSDTTIAADALHQGDGGRVIVWADEVTAFSGHIRARGVGATGDGGFVEVSGKQDLLFDGLVDVGASNGNVGTLLLDPNNITISAAADTAGVAAALPDIFDPADFPGANININVATLGAQTANVILQAANDITFNNAVTMLNAGIGLTAQAGNNIAVNADITTMGGDVILDAGNDISLMGSTIETTGGDISLDTGNNIRLVNDSNIETMGGTADLVAVGDIRFDFDSDIETMGGIADLVAGDEIRFDNASDIKTTGGTADLVAGNNIRFDESSTIETTEGNVTLDAESYIGFLDGSNIKTMGGNVTLETGGWIDVFSNSGIETIKGDVTLNAGIDIRFLNSDIETMEGDVTLNAGNDIDFDDSNIETLGGDVTLEAGDTIRFLNSDIETMEGDVTLNAGNDIDFDDSDIETMEGDVTLNAGNDIDFDGSDIETMGGNVTLEAGSNISFDGFFSTDSDIKTMGGNVTLEAGSNISFDSSLLASAEIETMGGNVTLEAGGNISFDSSLIFGSDIRTMGGNVTLDAEFFIVFFNSDINTMGGNVALEGEAINIGDASIDSTAGSGSGDLTFTADETDFLGGRTIRGTGTVTLQPLDPTLDIVVAGTEDTTVLDLTVDDLDQLQDGFAQITTGRSDSTGIVRLNPFAFQAPVQIAGGSTLIGPDRETTWTVTDVDSGHLSSFNESLTFANIENLAGGDQSDIFRFSGDTARISGNIDGGDGHDTLDYSGYTGGDVAVNLAAAVASGVGKNIFNIEGATGITDTLPLDFLFANTRNALNSALALNDSDTLASLDGGFTNTFNRQLKRKGGRRITKAQMKAKLRKVEQQTGLKPALVYAVFIPQRPESQPPSEGVEDGVQAAAGPSDVLWQFDPQGFSSSQDSQLSNRDDGGAADPLELVMLTAEGTILRRRVEGATRQQVEQVSRQLHRHVADRLRVGSKSYLQPTQQLYRWLVAPLEAELEAQQINNLTFIMDRGLRSVPIAALHDGERFILERFSVGLMPSLGLTDMGYVAVQDKQVLAMGAAVFADQDALPAVPAELAMITEQLWPGQSLLNEAFTVENLQQMRTSGAFGILHLATHADFRPGEIGNSYIQFADSQLSLEQLPTLGLGEVPSVELLVLSACRTALGDAEAELGFAGAATIAGVKSVLGSLWYVSDEGTLALMSSFYEQLGQTPGQGEALRKTQSDLGSSVAEQVWQTPAKAEALRQAQLHMIAGRVRLEDGHLVSPVGRFPLPSALLELGNQDFSHPYYWSAFTMIGNPW